MFIGKPHDSSLKKINTENAFEYIANYDPTIIEKSDISDFKKIKLEQLCFIPGEFKVPVRKNKNLLSKNLVVIDYDDVAYSDREFKDIISSKLQGASYILYPTISYTAEYIRYRLVIDVTRAYKENENKALMDAIVDHIGIPSDSSSSTWSQLQMLPVITMNSSKELVVINRGNPINIDKILQQRPLKKQPSFNKTSGERTSFIVGKDRAVELVKEYVFKNSQWLEERSNFQLPYFCIKYNFEQGYIDQNLAEELVATLAGDNSQWQQENVEHFRKDKTPARLDKSIEEFFGGQNKKTATLEEIKIELQNRRKYELAILTEEWELRGKKGKQPLAIHPVRCANILKEYFYFCLFDTGENTRLAIYQTDEGIYTQSETYIRRIISILEPTFNANKAGDVIYYLWSSASVRKKTLSKTLIPVKNGVFNLQTKKLEPFSPDYIFTSKISTPYISDSINPEINGWNFNDWLNEIACGDQQIIQLLWQVISASLNGNFSRRKSIWLVGDGNNGKGTFQQLLRNLIGTSNIATLKLPQFQERFSLSLLEEKVCCIGDDVPAGVYIDDSSNFNSVVTGDEVMVEQKNKAAYSASFHMTVIQSTNGMPRIHNKTNGTYRRLIIVPFNASFSGSSDNWRIKDEFINDPAILQYVLHRSLNMDFEQFIIPKSSEHLLEEYKQENDPLVDFKISVFDEMKLNKIPFYLVYDAYNEFCRINHYSPLSKIKFSRQFSKIIGESWIQERKKCIDYSAEKITHEFLSSDVSLPALGKTYNYYINNNLSVVGY